MAEKHNKAELVNQLMKPFNSEKLGQIEGLDQNEILELKEGLQRCKILADFALPRGLKLLVDAEYTYMNDGISIVALAMMKHYNITEAKIGNTYQCYLKNTLNTIKQEYDIVTENSSAKFGAKIVRGAYMEKERKLARIENYPDPVNDTYEDTGKMYQNVISYLLERNDGYIVIATHNEDAVKKIAQKLRTQEFQGKFVFAQIYGMGEQITMPLGNSTLFLMNTILICILQLQLTMDLPFTNLCHTDHLKKCYPICRVGLRKIAQFCLVRAKNGIYLRLNCAEEF